MECSDWSVFVPDPQRVDPDREAREVHILVRRAPPAKLAEAARGLGIVTDDPEVAARGVLREMRARGWRIEFPGWRGE